MKERPAAHRGSKQTQGGFLLPQLALVVLVLSLVTGYAGQQYWQKTVNEGRDAAARLVGGRLAAVNDATKTYATTFFTQIQRGQSVTRNGFTLDSNRLLSPTVSDLNGLGFLQNTYAIPVVYNGQSISFAVQMRVVTQNGCTVPTCSLEFQVTTTVPLLTPGSANVDVRRATLAASTASSSNAGVSLPAAMGGDPNLFVTKGGVPVGQNPDGIEGLVSVSNGYDSSGFMEFDRRDGSLPRTGSINMQDISGAKHDINNAGDINTETVNSSGRITAGEFLQIEGLVVENSSCSGNGLIGRNTLGLIFSCQSGLWKKIGGGLDGPYQVSGSFLGAWAMCTLNYGSGNSKSLSYSGGNWYYSGSGTQIVYCYR